MAEELDEEMAQTALELIEEFGKVVVFETLAIGVYDEETRQNTTIPVEVETKAIDEDFKLGQSIEGGLIEVGDKKLTVAAKAFSSKPTSQDKAKFGGRTWTVLTVLTTTCGEADVLYEIQVRRS